MVFKISLTKSLARARLMALSAGNLLKGAENAYGTREEAGKQPHRFLWTKPQILPVPMHSITQVLDSDPESLPRKSFLSFCYHHKGETRRLEYSLLPLEPSE